MPPTILRGGFRNNPARRILLRTIISLASRRTMADRVNLDGHSRLSTYCGFVAATDLIARLTIEPMFLCHSSVKTTQEHYAHFSPAWAAKRALEILEGKKCFAKAAEDGRHL
jgi:hypothetical protein